MKKSEMIETLVNATGVAKKDVTAVYEAMFELIGDNLSKGVKMPIAGFGTFDVKERAARDGINPLTKEPLKIPAKKVVSFKASSALKDKVN